MKLAHGALSVDIPPGWSDQSTLLFVAPRPKPALPTTAEVRELPTEALSMQLVTTDLEPQALLAQQAQELRAADPGLKILQESAFACPLGRGWSAVQRLDLGPGLTRQISIAVPCRGFTLLATVAAADGVFERVEPQLRAILGSLDWVGQGPA